MLSVRLFFTVNLTQNPGAVGGEVGVSLKDVFNIIKNLRNATKQGYIIGTQLEILKRAVRDVSEYELVIANIRFINPLLNLRKIFLVFNGLLLKLLINLWYFIYIIILIINYTIVILSYNINNKKRKLSEVNNEIEMYHEKIKREEIGIGESLLEIVGERDQWLLSQKNL